VRGARRRRTRFAPPQARAYRRPATPTFPSGSRAPLCARTFVPGVVPPFGESGCRPVPLRTDPDQPLPLGNARLASYRLERHREPNLLKPTYLSVKRGKVWCARTLSACFTPTRTRPATKPPPWVAGRLLATSWLRPPTGRRGGKAGLRHARRSDDPRSRVGSGSATSADPLIGPRGGTRRLRGDALARHTPPSVVGLTWATARRGGTPTASSMRASGWGRVPW
jgi:hypothetical protein